MKNKMALFIPLAALLLVAAAFYLPSHISRIQDDMLMDTLHLTQLEENREDFSDSIRLSVPEKLMLLRNGELSRMEVGGSTSIRMSMVNGELNFYESEEPTAKTEADYDKEVQELTYADTVLEAQIWTDRVTAVMGELRGLQRMGALPTLWTKEDTVELTGRREAVYIDNASLVSFAIYYMELNASPYSMGLTVDGQTNRILAFTLQWNPEEGQLNWGTAGASTFNTAWRDYWGMDQVEQWYAGQWQPILEGGAEMPLQLNGSMSSSLEIRFVYDGQTIKVPLYNRVSVGRNWSCTLMWNT